MNFKQTNKEFFVNIITVAVQALIFVTLLPSLGAAFLRGNKDVEGTSTKLECVDIKTVSYNVTIDK